MSINEMSFGYVRALMGQVQLDGGIAFHDAMDLDALDGSIDSLMYVDEFIDKIHDAGLGNDDLLSNQAGQNLIYALGFYVGETVAKELGDPVEWMTYAEFQAIDAKTAKAIGDGLETSIMYKTKNGMIMWPLTSILVRMFEGPDEKSVHYSALGALDKKP